ncbi:PH domain-containing protein [Nakamurella sp. GG22]
MTDPRLEDAVTNPRLDKAATDHPAIDHPAPDHPAPDHPAPDNPAVTTEQPWRRLAPGMLIVEPLREIIRFIPMLLVLLFVGRAGESGPPWGLIGTAAVVALGISRWLTTRYRITPTVVEVKRGLIQRKHLTVPRDRVRTVDVSAHPLQRVLRLVKVQIGTGTSHQGAQELALDGLPAAAAGPLRAELLHRGHPGAGTAPDTGTTEAGHQPNEQPNDRPPTELQNVQRQKIFPAPRQPDPEETELARLNPRWVLYAPATLSGVITAAFLIGLGWRLLNEASLNPTQFAIVQNALGHLRSTPLWIDILQGVAVVVLAVTLLSLAGYLLSFWGYRLVRHARGTLQVTRGLLTTRATSIEERRLHGVERSEPLLLRAVGGARLQAIATGLRERGSDRVRALLVPPAPLRTVLGVEAAVLGAGAAEDPPLRQHGPAARRRRYTRALGAALALVVVIGLITWRFDTSPWLAVASLLALPVAALLAADRYRNLGHTVSGNALISRWGSLLRRRVVLSVPGVIGVTIRQSVFQRRSGLLTVTATTAAGSQHYAVTDVPEGAGVDLLAALLPEAAAVLPPHIRGRIVAQDKADA